MKTENINVLLVDDDAEFNNILTHELRKAGFKAKSLYGGEELLEYLENNQCDVILMDIDMPGDSGLVLQPKVHARYPAIQTIMLTGYGTIDGAVQAVKNGAFDFLTKPSDLAQIESTIHKAFRVSNLEQQNAMLRQSLNKPARKNDFICKSSAMHELSKFIDKIADSRSLVLLLGESGVGKEVVANTIHQRSKFRDQPFVVVDCGVLQDDLLASELFGHEKGAFTGAGNRKYGLFEIAKHGTLFLDEIGEISPAIQVKLLRFLETGHFRRLGSNQDLFIDVRVIASTNRDLKKEMEEKRFREDLYYRLNVIVANIPPLRERREDIPILANHFLDIFRDGEGNRKELSNEALASLIDYNWHGNVRELRNIIERLVILSPSLEIQVSDLPSEIKDQSSFNLSLQSNVGLTLRQLEIDYIKSVMHETQGNRQKAAIILNIDPKTLYLKLKKIDHA